MTILETWMKPIAMWTALLVVSGCQVCPPRPPGAMPLCTDSVKMREEVLRHISIGMPVADAQTMMLVHGFECRDEKDGREPVVRCRLAEPSTLDHQTLFNRLCPVTSVVCVTLHFDENKVVNNIEVTATSGNTL